jgi:hypothetical protein
LLAVVSPAVFWPIVFLPTVPSAFSSWRRVFLTTTTFSSACRPVSCVCFAASMTGSTRLVARRLVTEGISSYSVERYASLVVPPLNKAFSVSQFAVVLQVLGGSSCTNACLYLRGSAQDYNEWDIPGWSAADLLPYFMQGQKDETGRSPEFHGKDGEWVMDDVRYQNPLSQRFLEVGEAAGLGTNDDFNRWDRPQDGVGRFQVSAYKGERCSGATAFLEKAMKRKNVMVRSGSMVRRINFDEKSNAIGVTYDLMGDDTCTVS